MRPSLHGRAADSFSPKPDELAFKASQKPYKHASTTAQKQPDELTVTAAQKQPHEFSTTTAKEPNEFACKAAKFAFTAAKEFGTFAAATSYVTAHSFTNGKNVSAAAKTQLPFTAA